MTYFNVHMVWDDDLQTHIPADISPQFDDKATASLDVLTEAAALNILGYDLNKHYWCLLDTP